MKKACILIVLLWACVPPEKNLPAELESPTDAGELTRESGDAGPHVLGGPANQAQLAPIESSWIPSWSYEAPAGRTLYFEGLADADGNVYAVECNSLPVYGEDAGVSPADPNAPCVLLSFDAHGNRRYSLTLDAQRWSHGLKPRLSEGKLFVGAGGNRVVAYAAADGHELFRTDVVPVTYEETPLDPTGFLPEGFQPGTRALYLSPVTDIGRDGYDVGLEAVSLEDGRPLWSTGNMFSRGLGGARILEAPDSVLAGENGGNAFPNAAMWDVNGVRVVEDIGTCADFVFRSGSVVMTSNVCGGGTPGPSSAYDVNARRTAYSLPFTVLSAVGDEVAYVSGLDYCSGTDMNWLAAIESSSGRTLWRVQTSYSSMFLTARGTLLLVGRSIREYALKDGTLLQEVPLPAEVSNVGLVLHHGQWIAADTDDNGVAHLRAYPVRGLDLADHGWVCPHGNLQRNDRPLP